MINKLFLILLLCVLLISCGSGSSTPTPQVEKQSLSLTYSFSESAQGFSIDTADYSVEHPQNDIIKSEMSDLPKNYGSQCKQSVSSRLQSGCINIYP